MVWFLVWRPEKSLSRSRTHQVDEIRALVAAGAAASVSAFLKHAVGVALFDAAGWKEMLQDALQQTGGPLTR
jgi:hypothetical protein